MSTTAIAQRIAALETEKQEMVETFIAFLEQQNKSKPTLTDSLPPLKAGFLKGTFVMREDFDEPLDDFKEYMQ